MVGFKDKKLASLSLGINMRTLVVLFVSVLEVLAKACLQIAEVKKVGHNSNTSIFTRMVLGPLFLSRSQRMIEHLFCVNWY